MKRCDHCDDEIETSDWYPTLARERTQGVVLFSFCSVPCRNEWLSAEDD
ncbi:hypothetical protein ACFR9U_19030 [Halorientalis brevis]|uniref:MYM-type domain-containing protein n=1 Tax=Halorientalis brevis TaxID=1126241 RepID=A0ABD6CFR9_9EURY|nr:hypothetical protein [Halorientalis brevis]